MSGRRKRSEFRPHPPGRQAVWRNDERKLGYRPRTIPPWWANPIVFVPVAVTLSFLLAAASIVTLIGFVRG